MSCIVVGALVSCEPVTHIWLRQVYKWAGPWVELYSITVPSNHSSESLAADVDALGIDK
jgi:hypothetical protein